MMKIKEDINPTDVLKLFGKMTCKDCKEQLQLDGIKDDTGKQTGDINISCNCGKSLLYSGKQPSQKSIKEFIDSFHTLNWKFDVSLEGLLRISNMIDNAKKQK